MTDSAFFAAEAKRLYDLLDKQRRENAAVRSSSRAPLEKERMLESGMLKERSLQGAWLAMHGGAEALKALEPQGRKVG